MTTVWTVLALVAAWAVVAGVFLRANHIAHRKPTPTKPQGDKR